GNEFVNGGPDQGLSGSPRPPRRCGSAHNIGGESGPVHTRARAFGLASCHDTPQEALMRKHAILFTATALLLPAAYAGLKAQPPAHGPPQPATISREALQLQTDSRSLPLTYIEELY